VDQRLQQIAEGLRDCDRCFPQQQFDAVIGDGDVPCSELGDPSGALGVEQDKESGDPIGKRNRLGSESTSGSAAWMTRTDLCCVQTMGIPHPHVS
jgi:hypothetical protein